MGGVVGLAAGGLLGGSLFGGLTKAPPPTTYQLPSQTSSVGSTDRDYGELTDNVGYRTGNQNVAGDTRSRETRIEGLRDSSYLTPLKEALENFQLNTDTSALDALINRRSGDATPSGYASRRRAILDDLNNANNTGAQGLAASYRGGDAAERISELNQRGAARGLADAYDLSLSENDNALVNLLGAKNNLAAQNIQNYANILNTAPLQKQTTGTGQSSLSRTQQERQADADVIRRAIDELTKSSGSTRGFTSGAQHHASPLAQLAGIAAGFGSLAGGF